MMIEAVLMVAFDITVRLADPPPRTCTLSVCTFVPPTGNVSVVAAGLVELRLKAVGLSFVKFMMTGRSELAGMLTVTAAAWPTGARRAGVLNVGVGGKSGCSVPVNCITLVQLDPTRISSNTSESPVPKRRVSNVKLATYAEPIGEYGGVLFRVGSA